MRYTGPAMYPNTKLTTIDIPHITTYTVTSIGEHSTIKIPKARRFQREKSSISLSKRF